MVVLSQHLVVAFPIIQGLLDCGDEIDRHERIARAAVLQLFYPAAKLGDVLLALPPSGI